MMARLQVMLTTLLMGMLSNLLFHSLKTRMRIEKCGWKKNADKKKNIRGEKREMRMTKKYPEKYHNFTFTLNGVTLNADDKKK